MVPASFSWPPCPLRARSARPHHLCGGHQRDRAVVGAWLKPVVVIELDPKVVWIGHAAGTTENRSRSGTEISERDDSHIANEVLMSRVLTFHYSSEGVRSSRNCRHDEPPIRGSVARRRTPDAGPAATWLFGLKPRPAVEAHRLAVRVRVGQKLEDDRRELAGGAEPLWEQDVALQRVLERLGGFTFAIDGGGKTAAGSGDVRMAAESR
jgi:hypothetical protein